jgi:hypothetical protein
MGIACFNAASRDAAMQHFDGLRGQDPNWCRDEGEEIQPGMGEEGRMWARMAVTKDLAAATLDSAPAFTVAHLL